MREWPLLSLRDAGVSLIDCDHRTPVARPEGYPYVAIPQMKQGRIEFTAARRISEEDYRAWTRKAKPQRYDVVLSRRTNPGVTATFGDRCEFALGQNLVLLRADGERVLPQFLRWMVVSPAWWEQIGKYINVGAVFDSLRCADVPRFELPIPPLDCQRAISGILEALDDKIELNRRMNETLETMARAIFRDWFVDFGPTRAKVAGAAPYHDADIWSAFPDHFDADGLPFGWSNCGLAHIADLNPSERLPQGTEAPYLDMASLPVRGPWPGKPITRAAGSGARFRNGDTIVARITPCLENGKTAFVSRLSGCDIAWGSTEFIVIRPRSPFPAEYGYLLARHDSFRAHAIQSMTGTSGRQRVQPESLRNFPVVRPTDGVLRHFGEVVSGLFAKIAAHELEVETLAEARDLLLPKLMSGELRVNEGAKIVEAAL